MSAISTVSASSLKSATIPTEQPPSPLTPCVVCALKKTMESSRFSPACRVREAPKNCLKAASLVALRSKYTASAKKGLSSDALNSRLAMFSHCTIPMETQLSTGAEGSRR